METAFFSRKPVSFRDDEGKIHDTVGITSLTFKKTPDNMNALAFDMSVNEINTITSLQSVTDLTKLKAAATDDSASKGANTANKLGKNTEPSMAIKISKGIGVDIGKAVGVK
jgi:hypothetical protein